MNKILAISFCAMMLATACNSSEEPKPQAVAKKVEAVQPAPAAVVEQKVAPITTIDWQKAMEMNKAGALLPLLKAAGAKVTQKDLDLCMEYIYDSFEFAYSGNDITNIVVYDENGAETFNLSKMIPFEIKSIAAGEGSVKKAPLFGIDITGLVSGIAKSIIGTLG